MRALNAQWEEVPPNPSVLIESIRDIGYSLPMAVADLMDNSITAGAKKIELLADTTSAKPAIGVLDDGSGMSKAELKNAMRLGTRSPREERSARDLGRFGLGLKTASFSQCRRVTVLTQKQGIRACAIWDLDKVAETNKWHLEMPDSISSIPWLDRFQFDGTLVVWQKIDRATQGSQADFNRQVSDVATSLELIFHRFLEDERGKRRLSILLNGRPLEPYDPFDSKHPATTWGQKEVIRLHGKSITVQPATLPHHQKVSQAEWERNAGPEGYLRNQGFYLYREQRLIVHGTWFNLAKPAELTKLARVRIDIPNGMDAEWQIDVKKASARPPLGVRKRLQKIIEKFSAGSKRAYTVRGKRLVSENRLPVWERAQDKGSIFYQLNPDHPLFKDFADGLEAMRQRRFSRLLMLVGNTLPVNAIHADVGSEPHQVSGKRLDDEVLREIVCETYRLLESSKGRPGEVREIMSSAEPFRSNWQVADKMITQLEAEHHA